MNIITPAAFKQLVAKYGPGVEITAEAIGGKGATLTLDMIRHDFEARGVVVVYKGEHKIVMFGGAK